MIRDLAARVFATRDMAHLEHWRTRSYAQHVALGQFYEALPGLMDSIVECYQGAFDDIEPFQVQTKRMDIVDRIRDDLDYIQSMREDLSRGDDAIGNLIDELANCYQKTLFLLSLK